MCACNDTCERTNTQTDSFTVSTKSFPCDVRTTLKSKVSVEVLVVEVDIKLPMDLTFYRTSNASET